WQHSQHPNDEALVLLHIVTQEGFSFLIRHLTVILDEPWLELDVGFHGIQQRRIAETKHIAQLSLCQRRTYRPGRCADDRRRLPGEGIAPPRAGCPVDRVL